MITLSNRQTRQFLLLRHGLLGEHRFAGKHGALDFVRQAGCIQFDPVDVCGKNAELTLQSRIKGFTKNTLYELLYVDRKLVDYPDKNLSIIPAEDWPYFERYRQAAIAGGQRFKELAGLADQAKAYIREHGPVCSDDLPITGGIRWHSSIHWSGNWTGITKAARSVLEHLYSTGELVIHHKNGSRKFYDLAERHIPPEILYAPDPLPDEFQHKKWRILRRIGAVGLLWDRPSDAWLNIWGLNAREIYTPADKRKYGHYVLPLLYGENFVGRVEAAADKKTCTLILKNIWYEDNVKQTKKLADAIWKCINRFAEFNECTTVKSECVLMKD